MVRSLFYAAIGFAASAFANSEYVADLSTAYDLKVQTDAFITAYSQTDEFQDLQRYLNSTAAPTVGCEKSFMIFARGTFEPGGTAFMGAIVGPAFLALLKASLGNDFDAEGVDYNNGVAGYLSGGDSAGSAKMASMLAAKAARCPNTKLIASGYSQGAQVTHNAMALLPQIVKNRIAAVVVFGDPNKGKRMSGISPDKVYTNCADSDPICMGAPIPLGAHLTYGTDTVNLRKCVDFIKQHVSGY